MCLLVFEADPNARAGLLLGRSKLHPVPVQLSPADGEADSKARVGSLVRGTRDSGAGACPLRCGWRLVLGLLVAGPMSRGSYALRGSEGSLFAGGWGCAPAQLVAWPAAS